MQIIVTYDHRLREIGLSSYAYSSSASKNNSDTILQLSIESRDVLNSKI
jgi:hypothetical protein